RRHDDEAVEGVDRLRPALRVLVLVLVHGGRERLVVVRQVESAKVDQLVLGVAPLSGSLEHPVGDLLAVAVGTGAAEDNSDTWHRAITPDKGHDPDKRRLRA